MASEVIFTYRPSIIKIIILNSSISFANIIAIIMDTSNFSNFYDFSRAGMQNFKFHDFPWPFHDCVNPA